MKTKKQIRDYAEGVAKMHFYADLDGGTLWEPFEGYPQEWIEEEIANMIQVIEVSMLWAQGD